jgi:hypothetical protein
MSDHLSTVIAAIVLIAMVGLPFWFASKKIVRKPGDNWGDSHFPPKDPTNLTGDTYQK